ncbi:D-alanine--D-alanine ligase, partial [bacterium]|nr:D-alanine--D-alanine ligase [bacterium]
MKILVLAGGYSSEREVSLSSGAKVTASLRATGHQARLWDVSEDISAAAARLFWRQPLPDIPDYQIKTPEKVETASAVMATAPTDTPGDWLAQEVLPGEKRPLMGTRVLDVAAGADIVFNVCHGGIGENGELAQLLAWRGIPFTGCSAAAAGLCMRKDLAKFFVKDVCATPRWYTTSLFHPIERDFPLPAIVKPVDGGSSIGVHRARSRRQLWALYQESIWTGIPMLFEERIAGRELSVGFLG